MREGHIYRTLSLGPITTLLTELAMACLSNQIEVKFEVDSRYSIVETIGNGAYGVVCSAVDNKTGCKVAIKKISRAFDVPAITKRTLRELKILKHFKHDNVIGIKEILRPPEDLSKFHDVYVVFDLMESDLHHIIHSKQTLSNEHIEYFLYQILRGLKYIHSANIIHRDLKPSNILVNHDCELKIGDFGMARSLLSSPNEQRRVMTEYVATRWYRAPELMLSVHQFSFGIDIWSVGCIFAEMLGRTPIFPGSNYLNQLQLILSVVGLPSAKFLSEIASERVRNYINKLPQKEAVPFGKLFPTASSQAIKLLSSMLKLDPRERCTANAALEDAYVSRYHDLDDEPSCRPLSCEYENVPLEKEILKSEIVKEIRSYHSKHPRPKLTPLATRFFTKPINVQEAATSVECSLINADGTATNQSVISAVPSVVKKVEPRKRKQKNLRRDSKAKRSKDEGEKKPEEGSELSVEDKKMLERWTNMQKSTKPFIHPIRKHMKELIDIQSEDVTVAQSDNTDAQISTTSDAFPKSQFQFTNLVPAQKGGIMTLVKDNSDKPVVTKAQKMPIVPADKPSMKSKKIPLSQCVTMPLTRSEAKISTVLAKSQDSTILVPMGAIPCYQIKGPFNPKGQVLILPNVKPAPAVNQSQPAMVIAQNVNLGGPITIPANSLLTMPQTGAKNVVPIAAKTIVPKTSMPDAAIAGNIASVTNAAIVANSTNAALAANGIKTAAANTSAVKITNDIIESKVQLMPKTISNQSMRNISPGSTYNAAKGVTFAPMNPSVASTVNAAFVNSQVVATQIQNNLPFANPGENRVLIAPTTANDKSPQTTINENSPRVCIVSPGGIVKAVSPKDMIEHPLKDAVSSHWSINSNNQTLPLAVAATSMSQANVVSIESSGRSPKEEANQKSLIDNERLSAELRKLDPHERDIVEIVRQLEAENENRNMELIVSLPSENKRPDSLALTTVAITTVSTTTPTVESSTYRSPDLEIPTISFSVIADDYGGNEDDDENMDKYDHKTARDVLLTTLLTPKTPKSGAYGYGLGLDLEELFNQTNPQEFWAGTRETSTSDKQPAIESAPLSSSLLNDWLGIKNLDTQAMEEIQKELETNTSLLLFDI